MPPDYSRTIEEFIYAGPFSTSVLIVTGIVLVLIVGVFTWRENRLAKRWLAPVMLALRSVAVLVVLWMLAEPTIVTNVEHTKSKSIGILVDTSASMGVVDDLAGDVHMIRWAAALESPAPANRIVDMDNAAVALAMAQHHFAQFAKACRGGRSTRYVQELVEQATGSVKTAIEYLQKVAQSPPNQSEGISGRPWEQILAQLTDIVWPKLTALSRDVRSSMPIIDPARTESIDELNTLLDRLAERSCNIADELADWYAGHADRAAFNPAGGPANKTRLDKVTALLDMINQSWLKNVAPKVRIIGYRFDRSVLPMAGIDLSAPLAVSHSTDSAALATDLSAALERIAVDAAEETVEAAFLLTDGGHNTGDNPVQVASAMSGLEVYIVPIGKTDPVRDVSLHHVQAPRTVFKNDLIVIEAMVDAHECNGEELVVELLKADSVLDGKKITVASDAFVQQLTFSQNAEEVGMHEYHLRVREIPDERVSDNNEVKINVEVIEDNIRLLLADNLPRWEFRYLQNLFKRDKHIEFDVLLVEPASSEVDQSAQRLDFPRDLDEWSKYKVVILGDIGPSTLTPQQQSMLIDYVDRRAGVLVLIAGDQWMPGAYLDKSWAQMVPVLASYDPPAQDTAFELFVTDEGASVPGLQLSDDPLVQDRIWREQLPVYNLSPYSQAKPTSQVLIGAASSRTNRREDQVRSFLCWQRYGSGRVIYLSAPVTYRLRHRVGDRYHHQFWGQLLRWAVAREMAGGSKTVRLVTDKTRYAKDDQVQVTVHLIRLDGEPASGSAGRIVARRDERIVAAADLVEDENVPGTYRSTLKDLPTGMVVIRPEGPQVESLLATEGYTEAVETVITIDPDISLELRNTRCNLPLLKQIAVSTGGLVVPPTALTTAIAQLNLSPEVSQQITRRPLWTRWTCLWVFLGCLTAEWVLRKLVGLS